MEAQKNHIVKARLLLLGGLVLVGVCGATGSVSALSTHAVADPLLPVVGDVSSYQATLDDYMGNLFEIIHVTTFYIGLTALMIGVVLSFLGQQRSERSLMGYSVGVGGLLLLLLYFGYEVLFGLLQWTFKVGTW